MQYRFIISAALLAVVTPACHRAGFGSDRSTAIRKLLDRNAAKRILGDSTSFYPDFLDVNVGRYGDCHQPDYEDVSHSAEYALLSKLGYITVNKIKPKLWNVQLTELGKQTAYGDGVSHQRQGPCDYWLYSFSLASYDHTDVTGIIFTGMQAYVSFTRTYMYTNVALEVRRLAEDATSRPAKAYGDTLANYFNTLKNGDVAKLKDMFLGAEVLKSPYPDKLVREGVQRLEYDNGWKMPVVRIE